MSRRFVNLLTQSIFPFKHEAQIYYHCSSIKSSLLFAKTLFLWYFHFQNNRNPDLKLFNHHQVKNATFLIISLYNIDCRQLQGFFLSKPCIFLIRITVHFSGNTLEPFLLDQGTPKFLGCGYAHMCAQTYVRESIKVKENNGTFIHIYCVSLSFKFSNFCKYFLVHNMLVWLFL